MSQLAVSSILHHHRDCFYVWSLFVFYSFWVAWTPKKTFFFKACAYFSLTISHSCGANRLAVARGMWPPRMVSMWVSNLPSWAAPGLDIPGCITLPAWHNDSLHASLWRHAADSDRIWFLSSCFCLQSLEIGIFSKLSLYATTFKPAPFKWMRIWMHRAHVCSKWVCFIYYPWCKLSWYASKITHTALPLPGHKSLPCHGCQIWGCEIPSVRLSLAAGYLAAVTVLHLLSDCPSICKLLVMGGVSDHTSDHTDTSRQTPCKQREGLSIHAWLLIFRGPLTQWRHYLLNIFHVKKKKNPRLKWWSCFFFLCMRTDTGAPEQGRAGGAWWQEAWHSRVIWASSAARRPQRSGGRPQRHVSGSRQLKAGTDENLRAGTGLWAIHTDR